MHDVTTIWKRDVCSFVATLNAFDVRPTCDTADVQAILPFPPNPLKHVLCDVSHVGRTSNAFKVITKLQTFLFQMVVTSYNYVKYLWKYGLAKSSDNLYAPCTASWQKLEILMLNRMANLVTTELKGFVISFNRTEHEGNETYVYTEWSKKIYTLFTHQCLWNKFKWSFYFRVRV